MPNDQEVKITGEFDHTAGDFRITINVPFTLIFHNEVLNGQSSAEALIWVGQQLIAKGENMQIEERINQFKVIARE